MSDDPIEYNINRDKFILGNRKILFINSSNNNKLEQLVKDNLKQIKNYCQNCGYEFIYFPDYLKQVNLKDPSQRDYLLYFYPYLVNEADELYGSIRSNPYALFQEALGLSPNDTPCLYYNKRGVVHSEKVNTIESFYAFIDKLSAMGMRTVMFSKTRKNKINEAQAGYNEINEAQTEYNEKNFKSVDDEVLKFIERMEDPNAIKFIINLLSAKLSENVHNTLSRIVIDLDYKIKLVDYGDIEVQLTPLQKAVYLFFLNHPEGIMFNSVYEYRDELLSIYLTITNRDDMAQLKASIDDLVDPLSNSLSEKCSKIRSAFLMKIDERLAKHYYIDGQRGMPKSIKLPRDLVCIDYSSGNTPLQKSIFVDNS